MKSSDNAGEEPPDAPSSNYKPISISSGPLPLALGCVDETKDETTDVNDEHGQLMGATVLTNSSQPINGNTACDEETQANINCTVDEIGIPQDSFSMFYAASTFRDKMSPFTVFAVQMATLSLIFYNLYQDNGSPLGLRMNIPVGVPIEVTMAQALACIISVFTAEDFIDGLFFVRTPIILDGRLGTGKDLSLKWEVSNLMRMMEGFFVIAVSFVFIVQSTSVIELFLNFAGVAFVSRLDDAYFILAKRDLLGLRTKELANQVCHSKVHTSNKKTRTIVRLSLFAGLIIGMLSGLAAVAYNQNYLVYACKSVSLTVGEAKFPERRSLSGTYIIDNQGHLGLGRTAVYVQEQGIAFIGYCNPLKRWTVTRFHDDGDGYYFLDPCLGYDLQSERTRTHDITKVNELQYSTGDASDGDMKCRECKMGQKETCGWQGECIEISSSSGDFKQKTCKCDDGFFGHSCQFKGPCTELVFQEDEFPGYGKIFQLMYYGSKPLMVHDRPAYIQRNISSNRALVSALVLFDGGRWLVIRSDELEGLKSTQTIEEYLSEDFNAILDDFDSAYISAEASYGGMPTVPFRPYFTFGESDWSPAGKLGEKEFILLCADCSDDESGGVSTCFDSRAWSSSEMCQPRRIFLHEGKTVEVKRCNCEHGFIGPLCQTRPVEGHVLLHLEHGDPNRCSSCGANNVWIAWDLLGFDGKTCTPFPREPLLFEGANGTTVSRQLGLHLNETHFSVFISNHGRYFPKGDTNGANELICSVQEGSKEIRSIERREVPKDQNDIDFSVLLNTNKDFFGKAVDSGDIECFTKASIDENECDGSKNGTLSQVYHDPVLHKSHLTRAWIQLNLKVTQ